MELRRRLFPDQSVECVSDDSIVIVSPYVYYDFFTTPIAMTYCQFINWCLFRRSMRGQNDCDSVSHHGDRADSSNADNHRCIMHGVQVIHLDRLSRLTSVIACYVFQYLSIQRRANFHSTLVPVQELRLLMRNDRSVRFALFFIVSWTHNRLSRARNIHTSHIRCTTNLPTTGI